MKVLSQDEKFKEGPSQCWGDWWYDTIAQRFGTVSLALQASSSNVKRVSDKCRLHNSEHTTNQPGATMKSCLKRLNMVSL